MELKYFITFIGYLPYNEKHYFKIFFQINATSFIFKYGLTVQMHLSSVNEFCIDVFVCSDPSSPHRLRGEAVPHNQWLPAPHSVPKFPGCPLCDSTRA